MFIYLVLYVYVVSKKDIVLIWNWFKDMLKLNVKINIFYIIKELI